jgi:uncharacterized membrane protein YgaE (UPF0421/DUF939 family)
MWIVEMNANNTVTAVPLVLYFANISWVKSLLVPFAPLLAMFLAGIFSTTGGVMYSTQNFLASVALIVPALAALVPLGAGQPWIGWAVALTASWVAVFIWTYIDPSKRAISVPRLFSIFILMIGMSIPSETAGWVVFRTTVTFMALMSGASLAIMWFSEPLCISMTKELCVVIFNIGILLDASTQPVQALARRESVPHFHLDYPLPSLTMLRENHHKQMESIAIMMRENLFESVYALKESNWNSKLLNDFVLVSDCVISIAGYSARGIPSILVSSEWGFVNEQMDEYIGTSREIFDEAIRCLKLMYSGKGYKANFDDLMAQHDAQVETIMKAYTHGVKKDKPSLANRDNSSIISLDHWIYQLCQLNQAIRTLAGTVTLATEATSNSGWGWLIGYYFRAFFAAFFLLFTNAIYLLRCMLKLVSLPLRALVRKCCGKSKCLNIEFGGHVAGQPQNVANRDSGKKIVKLLHASVAATAPPKIYWDDYIREDRWKFLVRFVIAATAVSAAALCMHLYWIPQVNTPLWMITSCLIVMSPTVGSTGRRAAQRAVGTLIGALLGQITVIVVVSTNKYVSFGPLIVTLIITAYLQNSNAARYQYFWNILMLSYSIVVISAYPYDGDTSWKLASYRFLFVFCGTLVGTLSSLILPEYSYDQYLSISRSVLNGSHKAVKLIHESLAQQVAVDVAALQKILLGLIQLQSTAVAMRDDAVAEVFHRPLLAQGLRFLRYKLRDVLFATRLQILSATSGFGSTIQSVASQFIKHAEKVNQNINLEVDYVNMRLKDQSVHALLMPLTTNQVREDFKNLEDDVQRLLVKVSPEIAVQINSHLTLFRYFCVSLHDLVRAADHYYGH